MKKIAALAFISLFHCGLSFARECPDLEKDAVFAVNGYKPHSRQYTSVNFTRDEILEIASSKALMERPWANTPVVFDGPLLADIIAASGVTGKSITIQSKNEYATTLAMENANSFSAVVQMELDGEKYAIRNDAPMLLMHPIVEHDEQENIIYESYSIWKVCEINVD